jgi:hypothetical protein
MEPPPQNMSESSSVNFIALNGEMLITPSRAVGINGPLGDKATVEVAKSVHYGIA